MAVSSKFCGWVPEPLDTAPVLPLNTESVSKFPAGLRGPEYDPNYFFASVLQSIDDTLRHPETSRGFPYAAFAEPPTTINIREPRGYSRNFPTVGMEKPSQYRNAMPNPNFHAQGHGQNNVRGNIQASNYDPVGSLLENLESALKASETMLCRTQDLDIQAHAAIMQVKHLQEVLAKKETQYAHEINELHLLLRAERSERSASAVVSHPHKPMPDAVSLCRRA